MRRITFFYFLMGLFTGTVQAHDDDRYYREDMRRVDTPKPEVWVEGPVEYPAYPREENLLEYAIPNQNVEYRYLLDSESISVGDDGVVRYSIAIDPGKVRRSVVFEGIHCKTRKYAPYAYGIQGEQFQRRKKITWSPILNLRGSTSYRHHLAEQLLCSGSGKPITRERILQKLAGQQSAN